MLHSTSFIVTNPLHTIVHPMDRKATAGYGPWGGLLPRFPRVSDDPKVDVGQSAMISRLGRWKVSALDPPKSVESTSRLFLEQYSASTYPAFVN